MMGVLVPAHWADPFLPSTAQPYKYWREWGESSLPTVSSSAFLLGAEIVHEDLKMGSDGESDQASGTSSDEVQSPVRVRMRNNPARKISTEVCGCWLVMMEGQLKVGTKSSLSPIIMGCFCMERCGRNKDVLLLKLHSLLLLPKVNFRG